MGSLNNSPISFRSRSFFVPLHLVNKHSNYHYDGNSISKA